MLTLKVLVKKQSIVKLSSNLSKLLEKSVRSIIFYIKCIFFFCLNKFSNNTSFRRMKLKECGEAKRKGKERKVRSGHDIDIYSHCHI